MTDCSRYLERRANPKSCQTCGGRGEIGGFVGSIGSGSEAYQTDSCPDCQPILAQKAAEEARKGAPRAASDDPAGGSGL